MKIENIPQNILEAVRQRIGASDKDDSSKDATIVQMSSMELVKKYSGWELGDEHCGGLFVGAYLQLEAQKKLESNIEVKL